MQRCITEEKRWVIGVDRWNFMASRGDREGRGALGAVNGHGDIPGLSSISFTRCLCPYRSLFLENSLEYKDLNSSYILNLSENIPPAEQPGVHQYFHFSN